MDSSALTQLIVLIVLVILSGVFSSAETALTTVNLNKLRTIADEKGRRARSARLVLRMREDSSKLLSAILVGNNIVNLSASSLSTVFCTRLFPNAYIGIATGILTFLILIFGEITPKSLATLYNVQMSLAFAEPVSVFMLILTPVIWILNHISLLLFKIFRIDPNQNPDQMTESELRKVVDVSREEGVIEADEKLMINNVVDFGDAVAKDIMIPRADMVAIDIEASFEDLFVIIEEENYSRLPVYRESKDEIIGVLNIKDLLMEREKKDPSEIKIADLMRKPAYVYEYQRTAQIFKDMKTSSSNMCIVLDEYGITAGIITMEDLIEEIVGDIRDEYDDHEDELIKKKPDGSVSVEGSVKLDDLNDALHSHFKSDNYDSVGGLVIECLDRLPEEGDKVRTAGALLEVTRMDRNRVERVEIRMLTENSQKEF